MSAFGDLIREVGDLVLYQDDPGFGPHVAKLEAALRVERAGLEAALAELFEEYLDAVHQGAGLQPFTAPGWHSFISTWENAEQVIPKFAEILGRDDWSTRAKAFAEQRAAKA